MKALQGLRVLMTRPLNSAQEFATELRMKGGNPIIFPTFVIESCVLKNNETALYETLKNQSLLIFTSQAAVSVLSPILKILANNFPGELKIAAIGETTARKLQALNLPVHFVPQESYNSEAFFSELKTSLKYQNDVMVVKGEEGRDFLIQQFIRTNVKVNELNVYRRVAIGGREHWLNLLFVNDCVDIILATSQVALKNLFDETLMTVRTPLLEAPVLAASERVKRYAQDLGFRGDIITVHKMSSPNLIQSLIEWRKTI